MAAFGAGGAAEKNRELPGDHALTSSVGGSAETVTETGHLVGICRKHRRDENRPASETLASEVAPRASRLLQNRTGHRLTYSA